MSSIQNSRNPRVLEYCNLLANQIYLFYVNKGVNKSIIQYKMNSGKNILASFAAVLAISFILLIGPTSMTMNVFATANTAQPRYRSITKSSNQNALCVSGTGTLVSCNNLNAQSQTNSGNNALAQQGGSGTGKGKTGNSANQGIGQSQSSNQNALCVSGTGTFI